ncbi:MAG TPA: DNA methyltransferase [Bacteroidia bacterium]|nr:DNA methyltransferase [Bacteroidia bacterium]
MTYEEFLAKKKRTINESGFHIEISELNSKLFQFQAFCVQTALRKGKFAFFEDCGLGKTFQQLEFAYQVIKKTGCKALLLAPLAVVGQTIKEASRFGYSLVEYDSESPMQIANYEQLNNIDCSLFDCIVLDESSIIKNFDGATRKLIIDQFANTSYKLACTATPSPNDPMELGNHSEFLNIMSYNEMLAMYFVHDGGDTAKWRLKGHAKERFYEWVSEWAIMLSKPDNIGFKMPGYALPELKLIEHKVKTDDRDNGQLFNDVAVSATNFNTELRLTKIERLSQAADIVNNSTENFIIWIKQNEEGEYLKKLIPDSIEVKGSDTNEFKKSKLLGFANNEFRVLITKTKIAAMGMNYQNCHNQIFASLDFSFEGLYQGIRRSYRFGQEHPVNIYLITTDTMTNVIQSIRTKQKQFEHMQESMSKAVMKNIKSESKAEIIREVKTEKSANFELFLGDSVQTIKNIPDESIGFSIFSPPFAELYTYSSELEDMGNSKDYNEFLFAFNFLVKDIFRILWSGRNVAVHCMDLPIQKGKEGYIGLRDFSGMILKAFTDAGFIYHSRVTLWKNPVTEMTRTKALGLLHKQIKKDASMSRVGIPDYLMVFRKPGEHLHPVIHQDTDPAKPGYLPVDMWQKIASPVWMDIDYGNTLNLKGARDEKDEKHICPLQLDTIERSLHLWTNKGDTIYTPFAGIGSELFQAIKMGRKAKGGELKTSYFNLAVRNCQNAEIGKNQTLLFS